MLTFEDFSRPTTGKISSNLLGSAYKKWWKMMRFFLVLITSPHLYVCAKIMNTFWGHVSPNEIWTSQESYKQVPSVNCGKKVRGETPVIVKVQDCFASCHPQNVTFNSLFETIVNESTWTAMQPTNGNNAVVKRQNVAKMLHKVIIHSVTKNVVQPWMMGLFKHFSKMNPNINLTGP